MTLSTNEHYLQKLTQAVFYGCPQDVKTGLEDKDAPGRTPVQNAVWFLSQLIKNPSPNTEALLNAMHEVGELSDKELDKTSVRLLYHGNFRQILVDAAWAASANTGKTRSDKPDALYSSRLLQYDAGAHEALFKGFALLLGEAVQSMHGDTFYIWDNAGKKGNIRALKWRGKAQAAATKLQYNQTQTIKVQIYPQMVVVGRKKDQLGVQRCLSHQFPKTLEFTFHGKKSNPEMFLFLLGQYVCEYALRSSQLNIWFKQAMGLAEDDLVDVKDICKQNLQIIDTDRTVPVIFQIQHALISHALCHTTLLDEKDLGDYGLSDKVSYPCLIPLFSDRTSRLAGIINIADGKPQLVSELQQSIRPTWENSIRQLAILSRSAP